MMKQRLIITLIAFAVGFILTLFTFVPLRTNTLMPLSIGYVGLILMLSTFLYGFVILFPKQKQDGRLISSRLTPAYKFYLPIAFIDCFLFNTILILLDIYPGNDASIFVVLEIMFIIWIVLFIPCINLSLIYLHKKQIVTTNFIEESRFQLSAIKSVKRYFIFLYKLDIENEIDSQKIIFLPRLTESSSLFITPKSIKELRSLINH